MTKRIGLLWIVFTVLLCRPAFAVIAFVNADHNVNIATTTTVVSHTLSVTSGNTLVLGVGWGFSAASATASATDNVGNTYTVATASNPALSQCTAILYAENVTGNGALVVTVTLSANGQFPTLVTAQFSGLATSSSLDVVNSSATGTGTTATSGSFTTTHANDLIFSYTEPSGAATFTPASGYTSTGDSAYGGEYEIVSAIQSGVTTSIGISPSSGWSISVATFKDPSSGGGGTTPCRRALLGVGCDELDAPSRDIR